MWLVCACQIAVVFSELVAGLKAAEDERLAKEAEQQGETEGQDADKMPPGSSISKGEKPKSGKQVIKYFFRLNQSIKSDKIKLKIY